MGVRCYPVCAVGAGREGERERGERVKIRGGTGKLFGYRRPDAIASPVKLNRNSTGGDASRVSRVN